MGDGRSIVPIAHLCRRACAPAQTLESDTISSGAARKKLFKMSTSDITELNMTLICWLYLESGPGSSTALDPLSPCHERVSGGYRFKGGG